MLGDAIGLPGTPRGSCYEASPSRWSTIRPSLATVPEQSRGKSDDQVLKKFRAEQKNRGSKALGLTDDAFMLGCDDTPRDTVHSIDMSFGRVSVTTPSLAAVSERSHGNTASEDSTPSPSIIRGSVYEPNPVPWSMARPTLKVMAERNRATSESFLESTQVHA